MDASSLAAANGDGVHLQPGMRAELFIKTSERTVLDICWNPSPPRCGRALRERWGCV